MLYKQIKATIAQVPASKTFSKTTKQKGRIENREVSLWHNCSRLPKTWNGIKSIVYVRNYGKRSGKPYEEEHYYISSLGKTSPEKFGEYIRLHWQIENNLHRELDVVFREDTIKEPSNDVHKKFAVLRRIAINIFRKNGLHKIKPAVESHINCIDEIIKLIKLRT
jgi:predicted transposase YbfD/YdcC